MMNILSSNKRKKKFVYRLFSALTAFSFIITNTTLAASDVVRFEGYVKDEKGNLVKSKDGSSTRLHMNNAEDKKLIDKMGVGNNSSIAGKYDAVGSALLSMMGGIPIGKTVSYGFQFSNIRAFPVCAADKSAPEVGDNIKGICYNIPMPGVKSNPVVSFTMMNAEEGGATSSAMNFNTSTWRKAKGDRNYTEVTGTLTTQIMADVYQGSTGLTSSGGIVGDGGNNQWGWSDGIAPSGKKNTLGWKEEEVSAEDSCKKYGVACGAKSQEEVNKEMCSKWGISCKDDGKKAFTKEAVDRANKTGDICGSLGNAFCGSQSKPKENQVDWKSGNGIGDQINNLLNDKGGAGNKNLPWNPNSSSSNGGSSNLPWGGSSYGKGSGSNAGTSSGGSFNSSDHDWMKSSGGGKGVKNLDEFFGGDKNNSFNSPSRDYPGGLTTDSFGLDGGEPDENGDMPLFNSSGIDTYGKAGYNPADFVDENGNLVSDSDFSSSGEFGGSNLSNILQDSLHDGLNGGDVNGNGTSLFESADKSNSLAGMIHSLLSGEENGFSANNDKSTLSNQDLFDIAKRLLLEAGFSEDDIRKGLNYDKDSAYTEPNVAWDFNRMTTLLKGRKVKFDNQHEIHQKPKTKPGTGSFGM
jgi:hypothetical protein